MDYYARESLRDVALDLFARQGYEATTLEQIAAAAGVEPQVIDRAFETKQAILTEILDAIVEAAGRTLVELDPQISPPDAIRASMARWLTELSEADGIITRKQLRMIATILSDSVDLRPLVTARTKTQFTAALAERLGVAPEDRRVKRLITIYAAVDAALYSKDRAAARSPEEILERIDDVFRRIDGRALAPLSMTRQARGTR